MCPTCAEEGNDLFGDDEDAALPPAPSVHACNQCKPTATFGTGYSLRRHLKNVHGIKPAEADEPPPPAAAKAGL